MKTKTLYTFDELSTEAQKNAIESCRDCNTDFDLWDEFVIDKWTGEKLPEMGFENPHIMYRGFASQGDGASFTAKVNLLTFLKFNKLSNQYRALYNFLKKEDCYIDGNIRQSGFYYHEYTMTCDVDGHYYSDVPDKVTEQANSLRDVVLDIARSTAKKIYKELEDEYDYLSTDDAVKETIASNDWYFDENGKKEDN